VDWQEPFGLVMIEAMACGTPVIGWRRGAVPEVIRDGLTGFVVDSIDDAVECVPLLSSIGREDCRAIFDSCFQAERMATDYLRIYESVIRDIA
jgi:glycosyltransferase involved in cell wall biosynthesis